MLRRKTGVPTEEGVEKANFVARARQQAEGDVNGLTARYAVEAHREGDAAE